MAREAAIRTNENSELEHALRNRLNSISLAMSIAQNHLERGDCESAESTLNLVASQLSGSSIGSSHDSRSLPGQSEIASMVKAVQENSDAFRISVILVEDNPNERKLLTDLLSFHGIRVRVAKNGIEALELLQVLTPDAILMDMHMPHCDGPTTIKKIRDDSRFETLPVFAVTGVSAEESKKLFPANNFVRQWFQKPVQSDSLVDAIVALGSGRVACVA
jgi:CheY-like chemotaxis protein